MGRDSRLGRGHLGLVRPDGSAARRPPTVALGYSFGTLHWPFVRSLLALGEHRLEVMARGRAPVVRYQIPQPGLYIGENRNRIVQGFMKTDAEWLLQVDTDIEFPPDLPERMVDLAGSTRKILAASVPLTPPIPGCALNRRPDRPGEWLYLPESEITEDGVECDAVATAVVLIHRDVLTAIADREGQCWFLQTGPGAVMPQVMEPASRAAWMGEGPMRERKYVHIGEDVLFCMRAEDAGFRSWCAKVPGLRHYKVLPLSHDAEPEVIPPAHVSEAAGDRNAEQEVAR
jgi:hypothetical protein